MNTRGASDFGLQASGAPEILKPEAWSRVSRQPSDLGLPTSGCGLSDLTNEQGLQQVENLSPRRCTGSRGLPDKPRLSRRGTIRPVGACAARVSAIVALAQWAKISALRNLVSARRYRLRKTAVGTGRTRAHNFVFAATSSLRAELWAVRATRRCEDKMQELGGEAPGSGTRVDRTHQDTRLLTLQGARCRPIQGSLLRESRLLDGRVATPGSRLASACPYHRSDAWQGDQVWPEIRGPWYSERTIR